MVSTEITDILSATGLAMPDISILSDGFLTEVGRMEKGTPGAKRRASC